MNILSILVGLVLLLFGRKLFWFFVAVAGFIAGMFLARDQFQVHSQALLLAIALLAGVVGAVLTILIQKLAIALAGFAAGGYLGAILLQALNATSFAWLGFLIGGMIGALLLLVIFDWALIGLSSLLGASLLADVFAANDSAALVFLAAFVIGVIAQSLQLHRSPPRDARAREERSPA